MATMTTLCGVSTLTVLNPYWFILEGLPAGQSVLLVEKTLDDLVETGPDTGKYKFPLDNPHAGNITGAADAGGVFAVAVTEAVPVTYVNVIAHQGSSGRHKSPADSPPPDNRLAQDGVTIAITSGFVPYTYVSVAGLVAAAGDRRAELTWDPGAKCDARGSIVYDVQRSLSSSMTSPTTVATQITGTSFTDTGLTNGTTYYYRIRAQIKLSTYVMGDNGSTNRSNVAPVTPKILIEKWGTI